MAAETKYLAKTSLASVTEANSNLDGSNPIPVIFTAGSTNGSLVKSVNIKATVTTTEGMIRLFVNNGGGNKRLIAEIEVPPITQSSIDATFERHLQLDLNLVAGGILYATTENTQTFHFIVEAFDWSYNPSEVRLDSTEYTAKTGLARINSANTSLTGTGTLNTDIWTVVTAGTSGSGWYGCRINSITVKAMQSTTKGMVRLFVYDGSSVTKILCEIPIPAVTYSTKRKTFEHTVYFPDGLTIAPSYAIRATTQNSELFTVIANAEDYTYAS